MTSITITEGRKCKATSAAAVMPRAQIATERRPTGNATGTRPAGWLRAPLALRAAESGSVFGAPVGH